MRKASTKECIRPRVDRHRNRLYHEMSKQISCATTVLNDPKIAASEIDRCFNAMLYHRQPIYIGIPVDLVYQKISTSSLQVPLATTLPPNDTKLEEKVVQEIWTKLERQSTAVMIVDGGRRP